MRASIKKYIKERRITMIVNYDKIIEIYGENCLTLILENIQNVEKNINYLNALGYTDTIDIFERYPYLFIKTELEFKNQINKLINKLGFDHVNIIENNLDLLEKLE